MQSHGRRDTARAKLLPQLVARRGAEGGRLGRVDGGEVGGDGRRWLLHAASLRVLRSVDALGLRGGSHAYACAPASIALKSFPVAITTASIPFIIPLLWVTAL